MHIRMFLISPGKGIYNYYLGNKMAIVEHSNTVYIMYVDEQSMNYISLQKNS